MKNNFHKNSLISTLILAVIVLAMLAVSIAFSAQGEALAEEAVVIDSSTTVATTPSSQIVVDGVTYYKIQTSQEMKWALTNSTGDKYLLMKNFTINDTTWVDSLSESSNNNHFYGMVLGDDNKPTGEYRTLRFAPGANSENVDATNSTYVGLFAIFGGSLNKIKYVYSGKIDFNGSSATSSDGIFYGGGLCGIFRGQINDCQYIYSGTLNYYANSKGRTMFIGGVAGLFEGGRIYNSDIAISGNIVSSNLVAKSESDQKIDASECKQYVGGIAGQASKNGATSETVIEASTIGVSGTLSTSDLSITSFWTELLPFLKDENGVSYIFPVGGLFASATQAKITQCDIEISGALSSSGTDLASKEGAIVGGIIGITTGTTPKIVFTQSTYTMSGTISTTNTTDSGMVYQGGIIGKIPSQIDSNTTLSNIVIYKESNMYNADVASNKCPGGNYYGLLCGYGDTFSSWNAGNLWVIGNISSVRMLSTLSGSSVAGSTSYGLVHSLKVYGGGEVTAEFESNGLVFFAYQRTSPFYGWYNSRSNLENNVKYQNSGEIGTRKIVINAQTNETAVINTFKPKGTYTQSQSISGLFLTTEISTSGNMVQFANEMNAGYSNDEVDSSGDTLNFDWISVKLTKDITFTSGMSPIISFKGSFDGQGHTITFASSSKIVGTGSVAMFKNIEAGASFTNTNIVFAGDIYAGTQDTDSLDDTTYGAVLAVNNSGTISNINLEISQACVISVYGSTAVAGGLVCINKSNETYALSQINVTIEGKIKAIGSEVTVGGLVGINETSQYYTMINLYAKGEIVGSMVKNSGNSYSKVGGLIGEASAAVQTQNVVVNIRDYSNYNNNVLMNSCKCNQEQLDDIVSYLKDVYGHSDSWQSYASDELKKIQAYFEKLRVASRSQDDYDTAKEKLDSLVVKISNSSSDSSSNNSFNRSQLLDDIDDILELVEQFDATAVCASCEQNSTTFALVGNLGASSVNFANTWVVGSYSQYPDDVKQSGVGTRKLKFLSSSDTTEIATGTYQLNLIYVRDGNAICNMDISEISTDNIVFTVSLDTTKVFTGWYTDFSNETMVESETQTSEGFVPGSSSGAIYYSGVIDSVIADYSTLDRLAKSTNAGQSYEGITFRLGNNIECNSSYTPIGNLEKRFMGTFDGKGYTVTIRVLSGSYSQFGLFGCIGSSGQVKQVNVIYTGSSNQSLQKASVFGGISAYNFGTIGQSSTSNKITVTYDISISKAVTAGGIVGINSGTIQNAEVVFDDNGSGRGQLMVTPIGDEGIESMGSVGGVVAINKDTGLVKNIIVRHIKKSLLVGINYALKSDGDGAYAGGLVAFNQGAIYSCVVELTADNEEVTIASGGEGKTGVLIGYNSGVIDSLWSLYSFGLSQLYSVPWEPEPTSNKKPRQLICGDGSDLGNTLVTYGKGSLTTEVYANNDLQPLGGSIIFKANEGEVPFYNYTASLVEDKIVSSSEGGSGQNFSPKVGDSSKSGLSGKTYYAIFVRTEIRSREEYIDFAETINSGFKAYANYIVNLTSSTSIMLDGNIITQFPTVGDDFNRFYGSFNGNGYTIIYQNASDILAPVFGVIGENSIVQNLTLEIRAGASCSNALEIEINEETKSALGFLACANYGTIKDVTITSIGSIYSVGLDYAGGVVGYNAGSIYSISVSLDTQNSQGQECAGTINGIYAGGIAGYNVGTIGSDRLDSVKLVMNYGDLASSVRGVNSVGGIVGYNDSKGTLQNVNAKISGTVGSMPLSEDNTQFIWNNSSQIKSDVGDYATDVGGIAGVNYGNILSAVCYTYQEASFPVSGSSVSGNLGGIVGLNKGSVGRDDESIKVFFNTTINANFAKTFGGIVGKNEGEVTGGIVEIKSSVQALNYIGGVIGHNQPGTLSDVEVTIAEGASLYAEGSSTMVGGVIGYNVGRVSSIEGVIDGSVGSITSGYVGGFVGNAEYEIKDSFVIVNSRLKYGASTMVGLFAGNSSSFRGSQLNSWAVASNSDTLPSCGGGNKGYNVLKIVGNSKVNAKLITNGDLVNIRFTANNQQSSTLKWYSDISKLDGFGSLQTIFDPDRSLEDAVYHVCYFDLEIDNVDEFLNVYQYVNAYDLFNGVMFRLNYDIVVTSTLQPIGTKEYPFKGIFEGAYHTITIENGGIAGNEYSGMFGYVDDCAIIRNFVLEIKEDVIVGSGMSKAQGSLAGHLGGVVENVGINLLSAPYSLKTSARVGALAGEVSTKLELSNVWCIVYNSAVKYGSVYENGGEAEGLDLNIMAVLGLGKYDLSFEETSTEPRAFIFTVTEGFDYYDNIYYSISELTTITEKADPENLGKVDDRPSDNYITYLSRVGLKGMSFTTSFIDLVINNQEDFIRFAYNVNTYGDNGAKFTLNLSGSELVIDLSTCPPIGTKEHPFTGIFDGSAEVNGERTNACYTIRLKGNLDTSGNEYSGLFGYVGKGAVIRNLIVRADNLEENPSYQGQTIGDKKSIYTGYLASYLEGSLENVAVVLGDDTDIYNINQDSLGGIIGVVGQGAEIVNTWLILPENSEYNVIGGYYDGSIHKYYDKLAEDFGIKLPNVIYRCGKGLMDINLERVDTKQDFRNENLQWSFSLTALENGEPAYGFVKEGGIYSSSNRASDVLDSRYIDNLSDEVYLALFLDDEIGSYSDLVRLATLTNSNRRYQGVEFIQTNDITIENGYTPIGGRVSQDGSGTMTDVYKYMEFIGIYNGNGKKIIIPENVTIDATYAGIFGILGNQATIKNLYIEVSGVIGVNNGDSATSSIYAGSLAGEDKGANLENIIVLLNKSASLNAMMDTGRVAYNSLLQTDVHGNIVNMEEIKYAKNVWVLAYNNKYNYNKNNEEQAFYDGSGNSRSGSFNGGINVITVIAAGELTAEFTGNFDILISNLKYSANPAKEWYTVEQESKTDYTGVSKDSLTDRDENSRIIYASFLESNIASIDDLMKLAEDTNNGYDLYGLTFELVEDIEITADSSFIAIGGDVPFNATFNGNGHSITLAYGAIVKGKYAGIFGNIGQDGLIKNVVFVVNGQLGYTKFTDGEVEKGNHNTSYAGTLAYIQGKTENVIIIGTNASLESLNSANQGIAFGYDVRNLNTNVWLLTSSENYYSAYGEVTVGGESSINEMKVIGMGTLSATLYNNGDEWFVILSNDYEEAKDYSIKGWYSNYAKDNQLSEALGVNASGTSIVAGDRGYYIPKRDLINRTYEVVIINTIITDAEQLISIAKDINIGGYTYENTSFSIGKDIIIDSSDYQSIGTEKTMFMGSFSGSYNGKYYTVYLDMKKKNEDQSYSQVNIPLFAYNKGTITDLSVQLNGDMLSNSVIGIICQYNYGVISNCVVTFEDKEIAVSGSYVGGIVGINQEGATVKNSIVIVAEKITLEGKYAVGGIVGQNEGYVYGSTGGDNSDFSLWKSLRIHQLQDISEYASVIVKGNISVKNSEQGITIYAGGLVGLSQSRGYISGLILRIEESGKIYGEGASAVGGAVGRSSATIRNTVVIADGEVSSSYSSSNVGYFAGSIQGSANNSWLVYHIPSSITAIGNGYESVNSLQISGNGLIDAYIDSDNNIIFTNITPDGGASIDGWYVNNGIQVTDSIGNVYDNNTFKPNLTITGRTVNAVFINTEIFTVEDLITMAKTVNGGLFSKNLTFKLMNDIVIDKDNILTVCVGIYSDSGSYGFKHEFLGQGYTITVITDLSQEAVILPQEYMGIFGYATSSAVIKDLNVVYLQGSYGASNTLAFGGIVGVNAGTIENCTVTIGSKDQANKTTSSLNGVSVGGISGSNQGTINNCKVYNYGSMVAVSRVDSENKSPNAYAGGISGSNSGDISNVEVYLENNGSESMKAVYADNASGATYVGGISGSNSRTIEHFYIYIERANLQALSRVSAYSGGAVGSNIGSLEYGYVDIISSVIEANNSIENISGGIAGANSNYMRNIVVKVGSDSTVKDSAVYQFRKTEASVAINVWTYNDNSALNSSISSINNMTYKDDGGKALVVHNDYLEIVNGANIVFFASFVEADGITMYADAHTDFFDVLYKESYIYYGKNPENGEDTLILASPIDAQSISVKVVLRREFNSQTELKMLSKSADNTSTQPISGNFTIASSIRITDDFTAIGTAERPLSSDVTFSGGYNEIVFAKNADGQGVAYGSEIKSLFGYSNAKLQQFAIRYEYSLNEEYSAGICYYNTSGEIDNCVVYLDQDVEVSYPIAFITNLNKNDWVIGRMDENGNGVKGSSQSISGYGAIVINGSGNLAINNENGDLRFTAISQGESVVFAGFSDHDTIRFNGEFITSREIDEYQTCSFTAEFINSKLRDKLDLLALNSGLAKGYGPFSVNQEYTLEGDIEVNVSEISALSEFLGILNGNGHTLTVSGSPDDGTVVFNNPSNSEQRSTYKNIIFNIRALDDGIFLFDIGTGITLNNVAVLNDRTNACLNDTIGDTGLILENVFLITANKDTFDNAGDNSSQGVGIIYKTGKEEITFSISYKNGNAYLLATAHEGDGEIFAGWYSDNDEYISDSAGNALFLVGKGIYKTEFISVDISKEKDILDIQKAVKNGFEFDEVSFTIVNDIDIENLSEVIGNGDFTFKGTIEGNGYTLRINSSKPLFDVFGGILKNIIIESNGVAIANNLSKVSSLSNVVFNSSSSVPYISAGEQGKLENVWLISNNSSPDENVNYRVLFDERVTISASIVNNVVKVTAVSKDIDNYILWTLGDDVIVNGAYNYIDSSFKEGFYSVTSNNEITEENTFNVLAIAVENGFSGNIDLACDLSFDDNTSIGDFGGIFDGKGHTIEINATDDISLFNNCNGVKNLKVVITSKDAFEVAILRNSISGISYIENCILEVKGNAKPYVDGNVVNRNYWIVESLDEVKRYSEITSYGTNLLAVNLGEVGSEIIDGEITFKAIDINGLSYLGYYNGTDSSTQETIKANGENGVTILAYYVKNSIGSVGDWNDIQDGLTATSNNGNSLSFSLTADIEISTEMKKWTSFVGTLDGNYHSLIVKPENMENSTFDGFITLAYSAGEETYYGEVKNLAVVIYEGLSISGSVFPNEGSVDTSCWIVDYSGNVLEEKARVLRVSRDDANIDKSAGRIEVNSNENIFIFKNLDLSEYKLRDWKTNDGTRLEYINGVFKLDESEYFGDVVAEFCACYTIYIEIDGVDENLKRPDITQTATYWSDITEATVEAKVTDGYLFLGYEYEENSAINVDSILKLTIRVTDLNSSVTIKARYMLLTVSWTKSTYGDYTLGELQNYLTLDQENNAELSKYTIIGPQIQADGDTINTGLKTAYPHAGSYLVGFTIKYNNVEVGKASFGYSIEKKELQFSELTLEKKIYNTDSYAKLTGKELVGFIDDDNEDLKISTLDFSSVRFVYVNPETMEVTSNAGNGYYIMIEEGSYLKGTGKYFLHVDYALPSGIIYRYENRGGELSQLEPYTFNIEKADLIISVNTITIDYYKQFLIDEKGNSLFNVDDYFRDSYKFSGTQGSDEDIVKNAKLLVVEGDSVVYDENGARYVYSIKQPGDYSISVLTDALSNYNPKIEGASARFRVEMSKVNVEINDVERQYGDKIENLSYKLNIDGVNLVMTKEQYATFKESFKLTLDYQSFIDTYLYVDLVVEKVYREDGADVVYYDTPVPVTDENGEMVKCYGLYLRFTADNTLFKLENQAEVSKNKMEYLFKQDKVLTVLPREITVEYRGISGKVFASEEGDYQNSARAVSSNLVNGDLFIVTREEGEFVGTYKLSIGVQDSDEKDVTAYYSITLANADGYFFTITQREIKVQHSGNNYYYGDKISSMDYYVNVSKDVVGRIISCIGDKNIKTLDDLVTIKLGCFGDDYKNVGMYTCDFEYSFKYNEIADSVKFVLDPSYSTYTIIPRKLTIKTLEYERTYDTSSSMSFDNRELFEVSGFIDRDIDILEVVAKDYDGDIKADVGKYSFRPIGLTIQTKEGKSETQYGYLVENYVIDKISDGKYTIKAMQVSIYGSVGYYDEEENFIEPDYLYFGNMKLTYHFSLEKELEGYLKERYDNDGVAEMSDKQQSEWLVDNLKLSYTSFNQFSADTSVNFAYSSDVPTVGLRSSDSNIKINANGNFVVDSVSLVAYDIVLESQSGSGIVRISFKLKALDFYNKEIKDYEFINEVSLLSNESFEISDNIKLQFNVLSYSEGDKCEYSLSTLVNSFGSWQSPEDEILAVSYDDDSFVEAGEDNLLTGDVIVNYTRYDKFMAFVKEQPIMFALAVVGIVVIICAICVLSLILVRRRRILNASDREISNEQIIDKLNADKNSDASDTKEDLEE